MSFTNRSVVAALVATSAIAHAAGGQSQIAGRWLLWYQRPVPGVHVGAPPMEAASAHLTLRLQGDSILGEWQRSGPKSESPAPSRAVRGRWADSIAVLQVDQPTSAEVGALAEAGREVMDFLKEKIHGIPPMTTVLELAVHGDSLVGRRRSVSDDGRVKTLGEAVIALRERP